MIIIYTKDRAEKLASTYEKMRGWTVQRTAVRVPTGRREVGFFVIGRGVYAKVYKGGRLRFVIEHEWIDPVTVML